MIPLKDYGYKECYMLDKDKVYNTKTKRYMNEDKSGCYRLVKADGKIHHISVNTLLKRIYGAFYSVDNIPDLSGEEWKMIGTNNTYSISNYGRVKSHKRRNTHLLEFDISSGYARLNIDIGYGKTHYSIHKLVAEYFLPKPEKPFYECHHIDKNPLNNFYKNLILLSVEEHKKLHKADNEKECVQCQ